MNNVQYPRRPLNFSLDLEEQENEMFIQLPMSVTKGGVYQISNLGRVKSIYKSSSKIMLSYKVNDRGNFHVKLKGKQYRIKDLMYLAFFGEIKENCKIECIDGNLWNLDIKNLISVERAVKEPRRAKPKEVSCKRVKAQPIQVKVLSKPLIRTISLNTGDKAAKVKELNSLKKDYRIVSSKNGVYKLRLTPKEGDLVKIVTKGAIIRGRNKYEIKYKDGLKYYLKGVDDVNFFFADELEVI